MYEREIIPTNGSFKDEMEIQMNGLQTAAIVKMQRFRLNMLMLIWF